MDLNDPLLQNLLTPAQLDEALYQNYLYGGSAIRCLEVALSPQELESVWRQAAENQDMTFYAQGYEIETLEEVISEGEQLRPILDRQTALSNLVLAQRREGQALRLITVNPFTEEEPAELIRRARQISLFPNAKLIYSAVTPQLFRRCLDYAYPEAIYGPVSLHEAASVKGLISLRDLMQYRTLEEAVEVKILRDPDRISCLSRLGSWPQYDGRPPTLTENLIPFTLEQQQLLFSHSFSNTGELIILATQPPSEGLITQLKRFSARDVIFELTTTETIHTLINRRSHAQSARTEDDSL